MHRCCCLEQCHCKNCLRKMKKLVMQVAHHMLRPASKDSICQISSMPYWILLHCINAQKSVAQRCCTAVTATAVTYLNWHFSLSSSKDALGALAAHSHASLGCKQRRYHSELYWPCMMSDESSCMTSDESNCTFSCTPQLIQMQAMTLRQ